MTQAQQLHKILEQREKQIIEEASQIAKEVARKELALLEFELFYEATVPEESKGKAEKSLQKLRKEKWKKSLEEAKGSEEEALFTYDAA